MADTLSATAVLVNGRMKFDGSAGGRTLCTDYIPPYGNNEGFMPLELFLLSLCACMGGALSAFLAKTGKNVGGLKISATGTRRESHPLSFASIILDIHVTSKDASTEDVQKLITAAEQTYCPVAAMIKDNVELQTQFTLSRE